MEKIRIQYLLKVNQIPQIVEVFANDIIRKEAK